MSSRLRGAELEIMNNATVQLLEEANLRIMQSGYSTIIKESRDMSVALYDVTGQLIAQPIVQPVQLGALGPQIKGVIRRYAASARPGDSYIANHPYEDAQNHPADVTLISPVFYKGELVAWCANTAHKPDFGGRVPGSCAGDATDCIQEGLLLPPLQIVSAYHDVNQTLKEVIRCNTRTPELTWGDIRAQIGANFFVEASLSRLFDKYGKSKVLTAWVEWLDISEKIMRQRIQEVLPDGSWEAVDFMDDDGINIGTPVAFQVIVEKRVDKLSFRFYADSQTTGPINMRPCMVETATWFCTKALLVPELPNNEGFIRPVEVIPAPEGTVLNPYYLGPVNMYGIASQRVAGVVLTALAKAVPSRLPAPASGYLAAIAFAGEEPDTHRRFVLYEIVAGGSGGWSGADGIAGIDSTVTNSMNTPIEAIESEFPLMIERYELISDSGGPGRCRGGLGFRRDYRVLVDNTTFNIRSDRCRHSAPGVFGGGPAMPGACVLNPDTKEEKGLHSKATRVYLKRGDVVSTRTAGGGGWGRPSERARDAVLRDLEDGYITKDAAHQIYGLEDS